MRTEQDDSEPVLWSRAVSPEKAYATTSKRPADSRTCGP